MIPFLIKSQQAVVLNTYQSFEYLHLMQAISVLVRAAFVCCVNAWGDDGDGFFQFLG